MDNAGEENATEPPLSDQNLPKDSPSESSNSPGGHAGLSRSTSAQSAKDQWEALNFDFQSPQSSLKDLTLLDQATIRQSFLHLQNKLVMAMQEIDALQNTVSNFNREASMASLAAEDCGDDDDKPLWKLAWNGFRRGFTLTYFVRAGVGLSTKLLQMLRHRQWSELRQWQFLSESRLSYRVDAVRLGLFLGGFTSIYTVVHAYCRRHPEQKIDNAQACLLAGGLAGLTVMVQNAERRKTLALYMAVRLAQCWYNSCKLKGTWPVLSSSIGPNHGDAILFALAASQVMYAYVMRPKSLPSSYWKFIVKTGPIHPIALEAVRRNNRGLAIDLEAVNSYIKSLGGKLLLSDSSPRQIPLFVLHPGTLSSLRFIRQSFQGAFRRTFPSYFSLSVVPFVVLNFKRAMRRPVWTLWHAFAGAFRSTTFIASFVGLFMASVTVQRKIFSGDTKLLYALSGVIASASIFIEKRQRRAELALYVLPRAIQSAAAILLSRRLLPWIPLWEVALFAASMSGLMYYREHEPETMAPFLSTCISKIVLGQSSRSPRQITRSAPCLDKEKDLELTPDRRTQSGGMEDGRTRSVPDLKDHSQAPVLKSPDGSLSSTP